MANDLNDAALLERFVNRREQDAFAALVRRHAGDVRRACLRILRSEHDAEDVVQMTFFVLALKAPEIPWRDSVGAWLCAVARRLSLGARAGASRRNRHETSLASIQGGDEASSGDPVPEPLRETLRRDLRRVIDDELGLLPEKDREAVVLCDLEGLTHTEAARLLDLPTGSMSRRLGRTRAVLRQRLARRGLALATLAVCGLVAGLWSAGRATRDPATLESRAPFGRSEHAGLDLPRVLAEVRRDGGSPAAREQAAALARQAATAAGRIEDHDPGHDRAAWRSYAREMHRSALQLAVVSREGDGPALIAAAGRVNASCVQCHLAFRR